MRGRNVKTGRNNGAFENILHRVNGVSYYKDISKFQCSEGKWCMHCCSFSKGHFGGFLRELKRHLALSLSLSPVDYSAVCWTVLRDLVNLVGLRIPYLSPKYTSTPQISHKLTWENLNCFRLIHHKSSQLILFVFFLSHSSMKTFLHPTLFALLSRSSSHAPNAWEKQCFHRSLSRQRILSTLQTYIDRERKRIVWLKKAHLKEVQLRVLEFCF